MKVTRIIFKQGANIFDSTMGGTVYFVGPKAVGQNALVSATLRPDLGGVLLERPTFPPHLIPFDNLLDVGLAEAPALRYPPPAESEAAAPVAPVPVQAPPAEPKRGPGRPPKVAALALLACLLAAPAYAADAGSDAAAKAPAPMVCAVVSAEWEAPKGLMQPKGVKCPAVLPRMDVLQLRAGTGLTVLQAICCPPAVKAK